MLRYVEEKSQENSVKTKLSDIGSHTVVEIDGRLDTLSSPDFERQILNWIGEGRTELVIDFSKIDYVSSAGLRSLMLAAKSAKNEGGCVVCCGLQGVVKKVFEISGFSTIIATYDSLDDIDPK